MPTTKIQQVGQIQIPGQRPQNVTLVTHEKPSITAEEAAGGVQWVDGSYEYLDVRRYSGADLSLKLQNAALSLSSTGGIIDATKVTGAQTISVDFFSGVDKPMHIIFGDYTVQMDVTSLILQPQSNHTIDLRGTVFQPDTDGTVPSGSDHGFFTTKSQSTTGTITASSKSLSVASATGAEVGGLVAIDGAESASTNQTTTLNGAINSSVTTITLTSATGFSMGSGNTGTVLIDSELITYTGISTNDLTGCVRGAYGTTAASHTDTTTVAAVLKKIARIASISGTTITLDQAASIAVTDAPVLIGSTNVRFIGNGKLNGRQLRGSADPAVNAYAIEARLASRLYVAPDIEIHGWDFAGVFLRASWDCNILAEKYYNNGRPADSTGGDIWIFGHSRYNTIKSGVIYDGHTAVVIDERSSSLDNGYAGRPEKNHVTIGTIYSQNWGFIISGKHNSILCGTCDTTTTAVDINGSASQWSSATQPIQNTVIFFGRASGSTSWATIQSAAASGGNVIIAGMKTGSSTNQTGNVIEYYFNGNTAAQDNGLMPLGVATYTPTNVITDRSYDANSTSTAEIADVLGTLIADLQSAGILS